MKVLIDEKAYELTKQAESSLTDFLRMFAVGMYNSLPEGTKIAAMSIVRAWLFKAELSEKDPEKKKALRPAKKADPVLHLIDMLINSSTRELPNAVIQLYTEGSVINNIRLENTGEGGGSLSLNGDIGIGQDNSSKVVGSQFGEAVSIPSPLHS